VELKTYSPVLAAASVGLCPDTLLGCQCVGIQGVFFASGRSYHRNLFGSTVAGVKPFLKPPFMFNSSVLRVSYSDERFVKPNTYLFHFSTDSYVLTIRWNSLIQTTQQMIKIERLSENRDRKHKAPEKMHKMNFLRYFFTKF